MIFLIREKKIPTDKYMYIRLEDLFVAITAGVYKISFSFALLHDQREYLMINMNVLTCFFTVPVALVTLSPTPIIVNAGEQINLTCTTSESFPPANITWNTSSIINTDIKHDIKYNFDGLATTVSSLQSTLKEDDNEKQVYCSASNIPDQIINSITYTTNVQCKYKSIDSELCFTQYYL